MLNAVVHQASFSLCVMQSLTLKLEGRAMCYAKDGSIVDRREMLKVKVKSLASEAQIIRVQEKRTRGGLRDELRLHRISTVRYEARATHIAYGLIRGRTLERIEQSKTRTPVLWDKVRAMVKKYGPANAVQNATLLERCSG